jgi:hypothetical protein
VAEQNLGILASLLSPEWSNNNPAPQPLGLFGLGDLANRGGLLGYPVRNNLFPGEDQFFKGSPHVGGMASETGDVILNPYSPPNVNHDAVARNEAFRLMLRDLGTTPEFPVTPQQKSQFVGTKYETDEPALKSTIAARIYSGDPSANATPLQSEWVTNLLNKRFLPR